MEKSKYYRQGELVFKELSKEAFEQATVSPYRIHATVKEDGVIREGEKSGHKHQVNDGILYSDSNGNLYIKAKDLDSALDIEGGVKITHPEHKALRLEGKYYQVEIQREYDEAKHSRQVAD